VKDLAASPRRIWRLRREGLGGFASKDLALTREGLAGFASKDVGLTGEGIGGFVLKDWR
jgi:hypothetical protein